MSKDNSKKVQSRDAARETRAAGAAGGAPAPDSMHTAGEGRTAGIALHPVPHHFPHPSSELRGTKSGKLAGKRIVLGVTGSIAAVESVKLARELIRHGAHVFAVMSDSATDILSPHALEFATGNVPITQITGKLEHVALCGKVQNRADLLLIAPCTSNTLSKIAHGIDDTPVTTFAVTAIGSKIPVMIVPAMHSSMYEHEIVAENAERLKKLGIIFVEPEMAENKAKMADNEEVVENVIRAIGNGCSDFSGKKILIIAGSTEEEIDEVRVLTNKSSGRTGIALAKAAFERGAETLLLHGRMSGAAPDYVKSESFTSVNNLIEKLKNISLKTYDIAIVPAAISDYTSEKKSGKISSDKEQLLLTLNRAQKVIKFIRRSVGARSTLVCFKAEAGISEKELIERAYNRLKEYDLDLIVANDMRKVSHNHSTAFIIDNDKDAKKIEGTRENLAEALLDAVLAKMA